MDEQKGEPTPDLGGRSEAKTALMYVSGLGLSEEERRKFEAYRDHKYADANRDRCESIKSALMTDSPTVVFMLKALKRLNCGMEPDQIKCLDCSAQQSGGFHPDEGIMLCANKHLSQKTLDNTLSHELTHVWDHCRFNVDWHNLRHHACSEIRASSLSGECRWTKELWHGNIESFAKHHQECVKRRAILSVSSNPNCKDREQATLVVNQVFDSCFRDTRPYDEIY